MHRSSLRSAAAFLGLSCVLLAGDAQAQQVALPARSSAATGGVAQQAMPSAQMQVTPPSQLPPPVAPLQTTPLGVPGAPGTAFVRAVPAAGQAPGTIGGLARGVDIYDVIALYAAHAKLSYIIDPTIPHVAISYRIHDVNDGQALDNLLMPLRLQRVVRSNVVYIVPVDRLTTVYAQHDANDVVALPSTHPADMAGYLKAMLPPDTTIVPNAGEGIVLVGGDPKTLERARSLAAMVPTVSTNFITLRYSSAPAIAQSLIGGTQLSAPNALSVVPGQNALLLSGTAQFVADASARVAALDVRPTQVTFAVSVIEITPKSDSTARGLSLGPLGYTSGSGSVSSSAVPTFNISANLDVLVSHGEAKILDRGIITAQNATEGNGTFGSQVPILVPNSLTGVNTVQTINTGLSLDILPSISTEGISTQMKITYNQQTGVGTANYPIISQRATNTTVYTTPKDSILISGLYIDETTESRSLIPPFAYVPLVGSLFKHHSYTHEHNEVVVVVTPALNDGTGKELPFAFPSIPQKYLQHGVAPVGDTSPIK